MSATDSGSARCSRRAVDVIGGSAVSCSQVCPAPVPRRQAVTRRQRAGRRRLQPDTLPFHRGEVTPTRRQVTLLAGAGRSDAQTTESDVRQARCSAWRDDVDARTGDSVRRTADPDSRRDHFDGRTRHSGGPERQLHSTGRRPRLAGNTTPTGGQLAPTGDQVTSTARELAPTPGHASLIVCPPYSAPRSRDSDVRTDHSDTPTRDSDTPTRDLTR